MTEIPEHLLARARAARGKPEPTNNETVEVSIADLELIKEWLDRHQDTPFTKDGKNVVYALDRLVACIPDPPYEPDPTLVQKYANIQRWTIATARNNLIALHKAGLTVDLSVDTTDTTESEKD
jgi:hypothetical protein